VVDVSRPHAADAGARFCLARCVPDAFPDILKGIIAAEEARDIPRHNGPTLEAVAEPARCDDAVHEIDDGGIPSLDDEPSAESVPPNLRDQINTEVPLEQKRPTVSAWLTGLQARLQACASREEVERELLTEDACAAARTLKGAARNKLTELINAALAQHS
jgi:hypothetical protein